MNYLKEYILEKIEKDEPSLSKKEVNELLKIFFKLIKFYCIDFYGVSPYPNDFFHASKLNEKYKVLADCYYEIFLKVLSMKSRDMLRYLDYALLMFYSDSTLTDLNDILNDLYRTLRTFLNSIEWYKRGDGINRFHHHPHHEYHYLISSVTSNYMNEIDGSKVISDSYKELMKTYSSLLPEHFIGSKYCSFDNDNEIVNLINMTYFYFLESDMLTGNTDDMIAFLNKIKDDTSYYSEKMSFTPINNEQEMLTFIDSLYNDRNKVVVIK